MHNINNTNNAQFDDKNPSASPKVFTFGFFAENRYICTVMQGDMATAQAKRAGGRKTVQNDGRRCGDRNRKPLQFVDIQIKIFFFCANSLTKKVSKRRLKSAG